MARGTKTVPANAVIVKPEKTLAPAKVMKAGVCIREYNEKDHGKDYKKLADGFAMKNDATVE